MQLACRVPSCRQSDYHPSYLTRTMTRSSRKSWNRSIDRSINRLGKRDCKCPNTGREIDRTFFYPFFRKTVKISKRFVNIIYVIIQTLCTKNVRRKKMFFKLWLIKWIIFLRGKLWIDIMWIESIDGARIINPLFGFTLLLVFFFVINSFKNCLENFARI